MTDSNRLDATTVLLLVLVALVALPVVMMGMGFGGMMGYGWTMRSGTAVGAWPLVALVVPPLLLVAFLGGGYVLVRRLTEGEDDGDPPMEELRMAYARGDITDEEFETRRRKLRDTE